MRRVRVLNFWNINKENLQPVFSAIDGDLDNIFDVLERITIGPAPAVGQWVKPPNLDGVIGCYTANATGADQSFPHPLGRVPVGLITLSVPLLPGEVPQPGEVYFGSIAPTRAVLTVRCVALSVRRAFLLY